jgi:hypothetical protein
MKFTFFVIFSIIWTIIWLMELADALSRKDFDPVTKLTWILVIILVPVFGVVFYWFIAPAPKIPLESSSPRKSESLSEKDYKDEKYRNQPTECITCRTAIPAGRTACPKCGWSYLSGS